VKYNRKGGRAIEEVMVIELLYPHIIFTLLTDSY